MAARGIQAKKRVVKSPGFEFTRIKKPKFEFKKVKKLPRWKKI